MNCIMYLYREEGKSCCINMYTEYQWELISFEKMNFKFKYYLNSQTVLVGEFRPFKYSSEQTNYVFENAKPYDCVRYSITSKSILSVATTITKLTQY